MSDMRVLRRGHRGGGDSTERLSGQRAVQTSAKPPRTAPNTRWCHGMSRAKLLLKLRYRRTLTLLILAVITLGIYLAHYVRRQTLILNTYLAPEHRIPNWIANILLVLGYGSLAVFIPYLFLEEEHPLGTIDAYLRYAFLILMTFWGYVARSRMNHLTGATRLSLDWFNLFWSLFLSPYYFNFKVNRLANRIKPPKDGLNS
jgi:hypothetical protein